MQSSRHGSRPQVSPLDNAFSPTYLARLRERDDSLTAAEAELAGPWKIEPVPGRPGAVAILRIWEDLAVGDPPVGVLWHLETAQLLSVLLPAIDREPLFYLKEEPASEETHRDEGEDVLEETPDFLEEAPEDDQLWFEQKPPKDFDFDD